ncbi:MAG: type III pantothenate kinase [Alphaproteobacteria bacterium]|nr:type III pantothenate kinase [Alphaproteobacteria bacterium]
MLLAINANNTNTVFAIYDGARLRGVWRCATDAKRTADEYVVWLTQLMAFETLERRDIDAAILSSVVPATIFNLKTLCRRYFGCDPLIVGEPDCTLGIEIRLDRPEEAGADRLVNAVAGKDRYETPLIIVDLGTATTFDIIDEDGNYVGGVIAPGINLSLQALEMAAAKLPHVAIQRTEKIIGKSTVPAMQSGVFWGYVGLIEGLAERIRQEYGAPMKVVATGGLAPLFAGSTPVVEHIDPDLTLWGLYLIHRRNTAP